MPPLIPLFIFSTFASVSTLVLYILELINLDTCSLLFLSTLSLSIIYWVKRFGNESLLLIIVYLAYCIPVLTTLILKDSAPDCYTMLVWLYASGLVGWTVGISFILMRRPQVVAESTNNIQHNPILLSTSMALALLAGSYYLYLNIAAYGSILNFLFIGRSISGAALDLGGTMIYGILVVFCTAIIIAFSQLFIARQKIIALMAIVIPVSFFLVIGNRSAPSYILLGALAVVLRSGWRPKLFHWVSLGTIAFLTVGPLGQARLFWHQGFDRVLDLFSWEWFDLSNSELAAGINTMTTVLQDRYSDWRLGETYMGGIINGLPSFLQFAEYKRPAIWYLERYMPDYYEAGFGAGFSPVTEAYMNFGHIGPFIVMLLAGVLFGLVISLGSSRAQDMPLFQFVAIASFLNFNRIDFSAWFVQILFAFATVTVLIAVTRVVKNNKIESRTHSISLR